jgi:hypothetical protein
VGLAKDRRSDRSQFRSSIASIVQFPVLKLPFSCPRGAPGLRPPCRRHRLRPRMAGRWHGVPVGVLAPHRAWSLRARLWSIGFGGVDLKISSAPPLPRPTFHSVAVGLPNPHYLECRGGLAFPCGVPSLPAARLPYVPLPCGLPHRWYDSHPRQHRCGLNSASTMPIRPTFRMEPSVAPRLSTERHHPGTGRLGAATPCAVARHGWSWMLV